MIRLMSTKIKSDWTGAHFTGWRARCGFTQDEAAQAIGITARRIRDFEAGRDEIPRTIELACHHLENRRGRKALAEAARRLADELDPPA